MGVLIRESVPQNDQFIQSLGIYSRQKLSHFVQAQVREV